MTRTLRTESSEAVGLAALRSSLKGLAREVRKIQTRVERLKLQLDSFDNRWKRVSSAEALSGADVRKLRAQLGETRAAFARRIGVSPSIVFRWESGSRAPRQARIVRRLKRLRKAVRQIAER